MSKTIIPCDDRCMFAKFEECDCECGGVNHQQGYRLTAAQRAHIRTRAGRRVSVFQPRTKEYRLARDLYRAHAAGVTKRDIAKATGLSAPTVRRYITRYLLTKEAFYSRKSA